MTPNPTPVANSDTVTYDALFSAISPQRRTNDLYTVPPTQFADGSSTGAYVLVRQPTQGGAEPLLETVAGWARRGKRLQSLSPAVARFRNTETAIGADRPFRSRRGHAASYHADRTPARHPGDGNWALW